MILRVILQLSYKVSLKYDNSRIL